jgi:hypothetical protein
MSEFDLSKFKRYIDNRVKYNQCSYPTQTIQFRNSSHPLKISVQIFQWIIRITHFYKESMNLQVQVAISDRFRLPPMTLFFGFQFFLRRTPAIVLEIVRQTWVGEDREFSTNDEFLSVETGGGIDREGSYAINWFEGNWSVESHLQFHICSSSRQFFRCQ